MGVWEHVFKGSHKSSNGLHIIIDNNRIDSHRANVHKDNKILINTIPKSRTLLNTNKCN